MSEQAKLVAEWVDPDGLGVRYRLVQTAPAQWVIEQEERDALGGCKWVALDGSAIERTNWLRTSAKLPWILVGAIRALSRTEAV